MNKRTRYSPEVRERAIRLVREQRGSHASEWAAVTSIATKIGCSTQTLWQWVKRQEVGS